MFFSTMQRLGFLHNYTENNNGNADLGTKCIENLGGGGGEGDDKKITKNVLIQHIGILLVWKHTGYTVRYVAP
ncbi:hypothetical protein ACJX0J_009497, partial [Zea mays]